MAGWRPSRFVVVCVNSCHPSYSETFVSRELAELQAAGHGIYSYSLQRPPRGLTPEVPYICVPKSPFAMSGWLVLAAFDMSRRRVPRLRRKRGLRQALRRLLVDAHALRLRRALSRLDTPVVLHAHFLAHTAEVAVRAADGIHAAVVTVHAADGDVPSSPEHEDFLSRLTAIRFASGAVRSTLRASHPQVDGPVIPCVAFLPPPRTKLVTEEGALRVTTIGRLVATKGYESMMTALVAAAEFGEVHWTVIGDGPLMESLQVWASEHSNSRLTVDLRGALTHDLALAQLDDADAFLLLPDGVPGDVRKGDGLPVALMEAMARGVPVITTDVGGISELVVDGVTGQIVRPNDVESVVQALWAAGRTTESRQLVEAAESAVRDRYSPASVVPTLEAWLTASAEAGGVHLPAVGRLT